MASAVALVQGASRGLGLQFCRSLLQQRPGTHVIATCRDPQSAAELLSLKVNITYFVFYVHLYVTKKASRFACPFLSLCSNLT